MSRSLIDIFKTNDFILFQDALARKKTKVACTIFYKLNHADVVWDYDVIRLMIDNNLFSEIYFIREFLNLQSLENLVIHQKCDALFQTWKTKILHQILCTKNPILFYKLFNYDPKELTIILHDEDFFKKSLKTCISRFIYNLGFNYEFFNQRHLDRPIFDFIVRLENNVLDYIYKFHTSIFYLRDEHENNLLHYAIFDNNHNFIIYLLKKKIDILNQKNMWSLTPLNEAIRLQLSDIIHLLRENGASLQNIRDSNQSIIGKRVDFFKKLEIVMNFVPFILSDCVVQLFHSQTFNSNLYCCSIYYCQKSMIEFHESISKITFDKNYLQDLKKMENCHLLPQDKFFLSPVCKDHQIKYMYTYPFCIGPTFLGIFVVWVGRKIETKHFDAYFNFIKYFMINDYKMSFSIFPTFFSYFCKLDYYKDIFQKYKFQLTSPISTYFIPAIRFFIQIFDYIEDNEIKNCFRILKKCHNPITRSSIEIYGILNDLDLSICCNDPSHLFQDMIKFLSRTFEARPDLQKYLDTKPPILLSTFDLYEIVGNNHDPFKDIQSINDLIKEKLGLEELFYKLVDLLFNDGFRSQPVIGTIFNDSYRIFLPVDEICIALDTLFKINEPCIFIRLYKYYQCLLEWIHPLTDGNGRTARFLITIYLRSRGFPVLFHSGNKILDFDKFMNIIEKSIGSFG